MPIDRDRLAAYDRVCGFALGDTLPPTYPHMLAFPLHLALMTDGELPVPGHRAGPHRQPDRPAPADRAPPRRCRCGSGRAARARIRAGPQFAIHTEARVGDELVWEEVSTNLRRGARAEARRSPPGREVAVEPRSCPPRRPGSCPATSVAATASVSGDLNPIHVHPLSARLFGFPSAIAHGMWTKARCLAALASELPDAFTVEVAFKRPILLPATVTFAEGREHTEIRFGVRDAKRDTPHLDGVLSYA